MATPSASVPAPDFVRSARLKPVIMLPAVSVLSVETSSVPSKVPSVMPRLACIETLSLASNVPPLSVSWVATTLPGTAPRLRSFEIEILPTLICVLPSYVLVFERVKVEELVLFVTPPAPEITPDNVCVADDAKVKVLPEAIEMPPAYEPEPKLPAVATVNPPAEITVSPEYVFTPDTDNVPAPVLVSALETPEITPDIVPVFVSATCKVEAALIVTAPLSVPV